MKRLLKRIFLSNFMNNLTKIVLGAYLGAGAIAGLGHVLYEHLKYNCYERTLINDSGIMLQGNPTRPIESLLYQAEGALENLKKNEDYSFDEVYNLQNEVKLILKRKPTTENKYELNEIGKKLANFALKYNGNPISAAISLACIAGLIALLKPRSNLQ